MAALGGAPPEGGEPLPCPRLRPCRPSAPPPAPTSPLCLVCGRFPSPRFRTDPPEAPPPLLLLQRQLQRPPGARALLSGCRTHPPLVGSGQTLPCCCPLPRVGPPTTPRAAGSPRGGGDPTPTPSSAGALQLQEGVDCGSGGSGQSCRPCQSSQRTCLLFQTRTGRPP